MALATGDKGNRFEPPKSLLEIIFEGLDSLARRIASYTPLGRQIRNVIRHPSDEVINWDQVRDIAIATLNIQKWKPPELSAPMIEQYQIMLETAERKVREYTGLNAENLPEKIEVFSQKEWIEANIPSFRYLFEPLSEKYLDYVEKTGYRDKAGEKIGHTLLTIQIGIIIGYLARNVLGQFDLSLPEPERGTRLYVVEPNVMRIQSQMSLDPREFRQWITLHEVTHSFEFHSNSWLKDYLFSTLQDYLQNINIKIPSGIEAFRSVRQSGVTDEDVYFSGSVISIFTTPEQRKYLAKLHATMCLLEGYSNHVMDNVGKEMLSTYQMMKERFEKRKQMKSSAERFFQRLIGINLKLEQYRLGQKFVEDVVKRKGIDFMNLVWKGAAYLPDMKEIRTPLLWINRIEKNHFTGDSGLNS